MPVLVEPAGSDEPADQPVNRARRRIQGAGQFRERDPRTVDSGLDDLHHSIDRAVVSWSSLGVIGGGGSEIRTRARLPYNGFQGRYAMSFRIPCWASSYLQRWTSTEPMAARHCTPIEHLIGVGLGVMPKTKKGRNPNLAGSIRRRPSGLYEARVTTGFDEEGRQLRKSVYGRTNAEVRAKMIKLQGQVDKSAPIPRGRVPTLADYAEPWLDQLQRRPSTVRRYGELLKFHIIPAIGRLQLTKIERSDVIAMMRRVQKAGAEERHCQSNKGAAPQHPQRGDPRRPGLQKRCGAGAAPSDIGRHHRQTPASGGRGVLLRSRWPELGRSTVALPAWYGVPSRGGPGADLETGRPRVRCHSLREGTPA